MGTHKKPLGEIRKKLSQNYHKVLPHKSVEKVHLSGDRAMPRNIGSELVKPCPAE